MIQIKPLSNLTWNNFVELMESDSQCRDCWCLNHRAQSGCPTGADAKDKMKELVDDNIAHGLLAFKNNECIGWVSVDPMASLVGHDCQPSGKQDEWSIHCLFVKDGFRGSGLSSEMIKAAIEYAKNKNAKIISAFPIPELNRHKFPVNEAEFSGRQSTFKKLGFTLEGQPSDFYQRMELK